MPLVTRTAKGSPLTTAEMDGNLTFLKARSRPYANVAAMQADTDLQVGDLAQTVGYYAAGDGGGANYQIVSADTVIGYDEPNIQATNLMTGSMQNDFGSTYWYKVGATPVANALAAPDVTVTADFLRESATNDVHFALAEAYILGSPSPETAFPGPQELYCYVAKYDPANPRNSRQYFTLAVSCSSTTAANRGAAIIDIHKDAGTVTQELYGANLRRAKTTITSVGDYWYVRLQFDPAVAPTTRVGSLQIALGASNTPTASWSTTGTNQARVYSVTYQGDGTSGVYLWGWGYRPVISPGLILTNGLRAKPILGSTVRLSQFGATAQVGSDALYKALAYFGTSVPGSIIVDAPTTVSSTWIIPSNLPLRFEGTGTLSGVTGLTVNSQLIADNRAILPKTAAVTLGPRQRSVLSNWFGL